MRIGFSVFVGLGLALAILGAGVLVLQSFAIDRHVDTGPMSLMIIDEVACPPPNGDVECLAGISVSLGTTHYCKYRNYTTAKTCTNRCYETGTVTHCDGGVVGCSNANASKCLGYCVVNTTGSTPYETDSPMCEDKITFKTPIIWNTSAPAVNKFLYTEYAGECNYYSGCLRYATILHYTQGPHISDIGINATSLFTCADAIEDPHASCLDVLSIDINSNISTRLYQSILSTVIVNATNYTFQSTACMYSYKCFESDTDLLLDEQFQAKRALVDLYTVDSGLATVLSVNHPVHAGYARAVLSSGDAIAAHINRNAEKDSIQ